MWGAVDSSCVGVKPRPASPGHSRIAEANEKPELDVILIRLD